MTEAIHELDQGVTLFRDLYIAEIEETRAELGQAVVALSVKGKVDDLSQSKFGEWEEKEFRERGLIKVAEEIESAQEAARNLVAEVSNMSFSGTQALNDPLQELYKKQAEGLGKSAESLRKGGSDRQADELKKRAALLTGASAAIKDGGVTETYLRAIVELGAMKAEVSENLKTLETLVEILKETHGAVNDWIMTDVTISGESLGKLLAEHLKKPEPQASEGKGGGQS
jgi:hypothetical protein